MSTESNIQKQIEAAAKRQSQWTRVARFAQKRLEGWRKKWNKVKRRKDQTEAERCLRKMRFWRSRRDLSLQRRAFWQAVLKRREIKLARWLAKHRDIDWNGYPPVASRRVRRALRFAQQEYGAIVTSTTGGGHSPTSWHYQSRAVDFICSDMAGCQIALEKKFGAPFFLELFGPAERYIKNGYVSVGTSFPAHEDHIHLAA